MDQDGGRSISWICQAMDTRAAAQDAARGVGQVAEAYFGVNGQRPRPAKRGAASPSADESGVKLPRESERGWGPASAEESGPSAGSTWPAVRVTALLLVDSRHPGLRADLDAAAWLNRLGVTYHIVAMKIDKLARSERAKNLKILETTFATAVVPVSATSGEGMDELWRTIARLARNAE